MTAVKGTLTIESGQSQSDVFNKKEWALGIAVLIPSDIQGVLGYRTSDEEDGTFDRAYDDSGSLIQIDPSSYTLPAWVTIKADMMPHHYIRFQTFTDSSEGATQNQNAQRTLKVMGTS